MKKKQAVKKKPFWKVKRLKKRQEKIKQLFIKLLTLLFLLILGFLLFFFVKTFKNSVWDGRHQINFVVQEKQVVFYSFYPQQEVLNIIVFAGDTHIPTAGGFGEYPVANIYKLGELESVRGEKLLQLSLQEFLAVPVEGVVINKKTSGLGDFINFWTFATCSFKNSCTTNLTAWDMLRLGISLTRLKAGQIKKINFSETDFIEEQILPDGSQVAKPNYLKIDSLSLEYLSDPEILKENLTVKVLNATLNPGLVNKIGRLVKNMGLNLVNTSDLGQEKVQSVLKYKSKEVKNSHAFKRLLNIYPFLKSEEDNHLQEDLSLVLGSDFNLLQQ
jgi:hypothetical protein